MLYKSYSPDVESLCDHPFKTYLPNWLPCIYVIINDAGLKLNLKCRFEIGKFLSIRNRFKKTFSEMRFKTLVTVFTWLTFLFFQKLTSTFVCLVCG